MKPFGKGMNTIRVKILGSLFLVFSISMGTALFGMWKYQQQEYIKDTHRKAVLTGRAVESSLNLAMLQNNLPAIQETLDELSGFSPLNRVSIINKQGIISQSSDPTAIGKQLLRSSSICRACHMTNTPTRKASASILEESMLENGEDPHLVTIVPIANKPACHKCHQATGNRCGLGALILDYTMHDTYEMMRTVATRTVLTGVATFIVIILSISWLITHFIAQPIDAFMSGIRKVEEGDLTAWVDVNVSGEFMEMADSFNVMVRAVSKYLKEVHAKSHEVTILFTIVKRMSETIDLKKVKSVLIDLLLQILQLETVCLLQPVDHNAGQLTIEYKSASDNRLSRQVYYLTSEEDPTGCLGKDEVAAWLDNSLPDVRYSENSRKVLIPLRLKSINLGLICAMKPEGEHFSFQEKELIPNITKHIAVSLGNARFFHLATTDGLTSLYTKRYFETELNYQVEEYHLAGRGFCLLMLDLDHFKSVNDTYGHPIGDAVLSTLAKQIKKDLRHEDIACRYGGEEFVILLPGATLALAEIIADRLRRSIESHVFQYEGIEPFRKTISIGLAGCPDHAENGEDLLRVADSYLYVAKNNGRNQIYYKGMKAEEKSV